MREKFRCRGCGFELPPSYEGERREGLCFLCEPLGEGEMKVLRRETSPHRRRVRELSRGRSGVGYQVPPEHGAEVQVVNPGSGYHRRRGRFENVGNSMWVVRLDDGQYVPFEPRELHVLDAPPTAADTADTRRTGS